MKRLTEQAHDLLREHVAAGDVVVDATVGNGHDTVFLAKLVGEHGCVFGFDTQDDAIDITQLAVERNEFENVELFQCCHSLMADRIQPEHHSSVAAIVFNLGYLPGGATRLATTASTTIAALHAGFEILKPGGVVSVLAYVGHPSGSEEAEAVERTLDQMDCEWLRRDDPNGISPRLYFVRLRDD